MRTLFEKIQRGEFPLIVSLPENSADLAKAAIDAGAGALKLHLNCHHRASGTKFGSFGQERQRLDGIAEGARAAGCPLGIMAGAQTCASGEELTALAEMGFEFFDIYVHDLPCHLLSFARMRKVLALSEGYAIEQARALREVGADALEASVIPASGYGRPLTAADLLEYRALAAASGLPVIVPSQRRMLPEDVPVLRSAGVSAIMIGAVVTGSTPESLGGSVRAFRSAIGPGAG